MQTLAERLAIYTNSLTYKDIPEDVIHEVKRRVIDSLGCALGAYNSEPVKIVRDVAGSIENLLGATIIGTKKRTSPELAAFTNGTMIRYLDYNDTYLSKEPAHPSDNISTALSVAEAEGRSGKDLITAIVIGYEIQCRLCDAASLRAKGWDHVTYGAFSSGLVASKLMDLNIEQTVHTLGISGVANIALRQTRVGELSMWKGCAFANTARNAVFAAILAKHGMTGPAPIFEGEKGFMKLVSGQFELEDFGGKDSPFKILDTYIKFYPAEYHSQSAIEAAIELKSKIGDIDAIESIEVRTFDACYEIIGSGAEKWNPKTRETADHSLPYCIAVALVDGKVELDQFSEERIKDLMLHKLMGKIKISRDAELNRQYPEAMPNLIEIITKDGRRFSKKITYPKGHPKNPMTDKEVEAKFKTMADNILPPGQTDIILDKLWHLEYIKDVREIMDSITVEKHLI
ncbi:MAG: 2-methylcitrate dehydratase [Nitrospinae bacterium RIFCSPLOWO2_01_FULL_39_10]|nr:MAG: 2-methylcitrate dehydratase [Nitrospinae bacterium RIFCSPLOWO2_01_FULL_39_10]